jgi:hypothetical protein
MKSLFQVSVAIIAALVIGFASYFYGAHSRSESVPVGFNIRNDQPQVVGVPNPSTLTVCRPKCKYFIQINTNPTSAAAQATCDSATYGANCITITDPKAYIQRKPDCSPIGCPNEQVSISLQWK